MNIENFDSPELIEKNAKSFLGIALRNAHEVNQKLYTNILNICAFIFISVFLYLFVKLQLKNVSLDEINLNKKQDIYNKFKYYQNLEKNNSNTSINKNTNYVNGEMQDNSSHEDDLITGLPSWENEFELLYPK